MTNRDRYKQAFAAIPISDDFSLEALHMKKISQKRVLSRVAAIAAACVLLFGGAATAYAADLGGIQRTVQIWLHGEMTQAAITFDGSGSYEGSYLDENGQEKEFGGGGVAFEDDGTARPLTEEELMEELNSPQMYTQEGRTMISWKNQVLDITDKFENGVCYVLLEDGEERLYLTAREGGGFASSPSKYISPSEFSTSPD